MKKYRIVPFDLMNDIWFIQKRFLFIFWMPIGSGKKIEVWKKADELNEEASQERKYPASNYHFSNVMTLKEFRELTKDMPGDRQIMYHSYCKGLSLSPYDLSEVWVDEKKNVLVMNPGTDYDARRPNK